MPGKGRRRNYTHNTRLMSITDSCQFSDVSHAFIVNGECPKKMPHSYRILSKILTTAGCMRI